jgi:hypothetical protein
MLHASLDRVVHEVGVPAVSSVYQTDYGGLMKINRRFKAYRVIEVH